MQKYLYNIPTPPFGHPSREGNSFIPDFLDNFGGGEFLFLDFSGCLKGGNPESIILVANWY